MYPERKKGIVYSTVLHILLLALMIFGLPSFLKNQPPEEPVAITVEILPITEMSNVKPNEAPPTEKPKDEPPKEAEQKKPAPPVKTAQDTPPPPPPEPKPVEKPEVVKKVDPKKVEKKTDTPKPEDKKEAKKDKPKKTNDDDFLAALKAVKETAQKEKPKDTKEEIKESSSSQKMAKSSRFDPNAMMSISEKDAIMGQIAKCWNPPAGAKDAHNLVVVVSAEFNVDGSYIKAELADESKGRYNSDPFYRSAADSALRAVRQCSPLKNLSADKYEAWKELELHFDPKFLL